VDQLLKDKCCIITGSGRGVGRAAALMFAREGAKLVITDVDETPAMEVMNEILDQGGQAIAVAGDITSGGFPEKLISETVRVFGPDIDVLVNNAGLSWHAPAHKMTDRQWSRLMDVMVTAPFKIIREASPYMRKNAIREIANRGAAKCRKIINITSILGMEGSGAGLVNYSAAKAALIGLSRSLAKEWGPHNICVNCIAPGMIETRLTDPYPTVIESRNEAVIVGVTDRLREAYVNATPLGRFGTPEDVAKVILFFASPLSDFVTDEVLRVAGGLITPFGK
jgi:3-oxoacyl-[acyl-carrier protein] reductase